MSSDHLLGILLAPRLGHTPDVKRPVLPAETTDTSHVISVIGVLFPRKAVERGIRDLMCRQGKSVKVFTFVSMRAGVSINHEYLKRMIENVFTQGDNILERRRGSSTWSRWHLLEYIRRPAR